MLDVFVFSIFFKCFYIAYASIAAVIQWVRLAFEYNIQKPGL